MVSTPGNERACPTKERACPITFEWRACQFDFVYTSAATKGPTWGINGRWVDEPKQITPVVFYCTVRLFLRAAPETVDAHVQAAYQYKEVPVNWRPSTPRHSPPPPARAAGRHGAGCGSRVWPARCKELSQNAWRSSRFRLSSARTTHPHVGPRHVHISRRKQEKCLPPRGL